MKLVLMMPKYRLVRVRCSAIALATTSGLAGAADVLLPGVAGPPDTGDAGGAVTRICTVALVGALAWGWLAVQAGVVEAWRHSTAGAGPVAVRPGGGLRRWTLAACGVAVTGLALVSPGAQALAPSQAPAQTAPVVQQLHATHPDTVVVRAGDCLWSLAAQEVQPGAGPATVTARWRAIYRANRHVIGGDPDLIRPGQHLRMPR